VSAIPFIGMKPDLIWALSGHPRRRSTGAATLYSMRLYDVEGKPAGHVAAQLDRGIEIDLPR